LSGTFPTILTKLPYAVHFRLAVNQFQGELPEYIASPFVQTLDFYGNSFTGNIPSSWYQMPELQFIYIGLNELTGRLPSEIGTMTELRGAYVDNCHFTGIIPTELVEIPLLRKYCHERCFAPFSLLFFSRTLWVLLTIFAYFRVFPCKRQHVDGVDPSQTF